MIAFFKTLFGLNDYWDMFDYDRTISLRYCSRAKCKNCGSVEFEIFFSGNKHSYLCKCGWRSPII